MHEHVALSVADDLRGVERVADFLHERGAFFGVAGGGDGGFRAFEFAGGANAVVLHRRNAAGVDGLGHEGDRRAEVERVDDCPFAGSFLTGGIEDFVHERRAVGVFLGENIAGDLDEVAVEFAFVPLGEGVVEFLLGHAEAVFEDVVGLADELHVTVFDAVVDHLHIMAGTLLADPIAARRAVLDLGGDGLENFFHMRPSGRRATGHDARSAPCALLAAGDSGADEEQTFCLQLALAAVGVIEKGIAAVDDDVAGFKVRGDLRDKIVHGLAGLHEHHDPAWAFEFRDEFLNRVRSLDFRALRLIGEEVIHLRGGAVVDDDGVAVVVHVEDEILAHDGQSDETDVSLRRGVLHDRNSKSYWDLSGLLSPKSDIFGLERPAVAGAVEHEAGDLLDFFKVRVDRVKPHAIMNGERGNQHIEPRHGETPIAQPPREADGAFPILRADGAVGDDRKIRADHPAFLFARTAHDLEANRRAELRFVGLEERFQGDLHFEPPLSPQGLDPNGGIDQNHATRQRGEGWDW